MTPGSCSAGIHIVLYALGRFSIVDAARLHGDGDVENPGRQMQNAPSRENVDGTAFRRSQTLTRQQWDEATKNLIYEKRFSPIFLSPAQ